MQEMDIMVKLCNTESSSQLFLCLKQHTQTSVKLLICTNQNRACRTQVIMSAFQWEIIFI